MAIAADSSHRAVYARRLDRHPRARDREINRALATENLKARLEAEGAEAAPDSPTAFGALIEREIVRWKPVVERANMRSE